MARDVDSPWYLSTFPEFAKFDENIVTTQKIGGGVFASVLILNVSETCYTVKRFSDPNKDEK